MKKTSLLSVILASLTALLPACTALRTPGDPVSLSDAVRESVKALNIAEAGAKGRHWGLLPAEVTLTYNISDEKSLTSGVHITAPIKAVSIGADISGTQSTQRGNTIVMKFTRHGQ